MRKLWMILLLSLFLMTGCGSQEEVYEGNLDRIASEIAAYSTDVVLEPIEETKTCRAEKYTMDLKLDVENKKISGTAVIDITNETEDSLDKICFRNYAASILGEDGTASIEKVVRADKMPQSILEVEAKQDSSVVYVKLQDTLAPQESISLYVEFSTDIPKKDYRFGYHKEGENISFLLTYCFPVVAMYENGQWAEYPYISHAESNYHIIADYDIRLEAPEGYTIAATGEEKTAGNITTIKAENIRDLAIVASNYMKMETISTQGIDINLYALDYENMDGYNEISLLAGRDSIDLYTKLIGAYAYKELDIVQCFYSSAMEYPGLVLIGLPDLKSPEEIDDAASYGEVCSRIAHETAHQWFYAAMGNNCYVEPWLDESFAEYCEDILYPYSGCESVQKAAESDVERLKISPLWGYETEDDLHAYMKGKMEQVVEPNLDADGKYVVNGSYETYSSEEYSYSEHVYDGGAAFLHELQQEMGDGAFFHMLQAYYESGYLKEVTTNDFIKAVKSFNDSEEVERILMKYIQ